jgi:hypothetical protein
MITYAVLSRCRPSVAAMGLALILPLSGLAADSVPPEALHVKVFPDRYVAAGKPFSDLAGLEAWAKPIRIRTLWLDSCGAASTKRLLAAVERFHSVYPEGVQIRTFNVGEPGCLALAAELATGGRGVPSRFPAVPEYYATDRFGRSTMP